MNNKLWLTLGAGILLVLVVSALFAPLIAPYHPLSQNLSQDLVAFSIDHPLGTDKLGRDILSRILHGGRISLLVGTSTVTLSLAIGLIIGSLSGFFGGWIDQLLMRLVDILLAFPGILLAIAFTAVLGPGLDHVIIALCLIGWTSYARLVRGEILALRAREFVQAARALGGEPWRIIVRHLLPNSLAPLIVAATLDAGAAIRAETTLSFLGLGIQPPTPSWGNLLTNAATNIFIAPLQVFLPGLFIFLALMSFNLLGDALRDALDPKLSKNRG